MVNIQYKDKNYSCEPDESVLDALLRQGAEVGYGCMAGACQACMLQIDQGSVPEQAQKGLKDTQKQAGYFLACSCFPEEDLMLSSSNELTSVQTSVVAITQLSDEIVGLSLKPEHSIDYKPGQFINIHKAPGIIRSYSLASLNSLDEPLQLHVRRVENGVVSGWINEQLKVGDKVEVDGPHGECFYVQGDQQQPILMIGTGTGLAPLYGILREALHQGHSGNIHLFHGSRNLAGLYLQDELNLLEKNHANVHYQVSLSSDEQVDGITSGRALDIALQQLGNLKGYRIYLCGNEAMVKQAKKQVFLAGANMQDIFVDPFVTT